ncbi:MAG TPA: hypothetical protein VM841_03505 [Actinomycetota bacterium]|nr:hypothetical protein [Actinomycetota bacterium]
MSPAKKKAASAKKRTAPSPKKAAKKKAAEKPRETKSCRMCGTTATCAPGGIPPGWSFSAEPGGITFMCDDCARRNIRSIEAKLSMEWWE